MTKRSIRQAGLLAAAGAGIGFAYYWFVGCVSGGCPITSNPFLSTGYGALVGLITGLGNGKKGMKGTVEQNENKESVH